MEPNPGIEAVRQLANMGYRFTVNGETIKAKYEGQGEPDPLKAKPLIDLVRQHKTEVVEFLRYYCPRCGGCCFVPDCAGQSLCLTCDWPVLVELYPGLRVKH